MQPPRAVSAGHRHRVSCRGAQPGNQRYFLQLRPVRARLLQRCNDGERARLRTERCGVPGFIHAMVRPEQDHRRQCLRWQRVLSTRGGGSELRRVRGRHLQPPGNRERRLHQKVCNQVSPWAISASGGGGIPRRQCVHQLPAEHVLSRGGHAGGMHSERGSGRYVRCLRCQRRPGRLCRRMRRWSRRRCSPNVVVGSNVQRLRSRRHVFQRQRCLRGCHRMRRWCGGRCSPNIGVRPNVHRRG